MLSLSGEIVDRILAHTVPSFQLTSQSTRNLGFGNIFYGFARSMRPKHVVVIGSKAGFSPVCFALAVKDNEGTGIESVECGETTLSNPAAVGKVSFVDPSKSVHRGDPNHSYGIGTWDDPRDTQRIFARYGVDKIVTHFKMTSEEFLSLDPAQSIDLLYIDGDHSYDGIMHDLVKFHDRLGAKSMVIAHDVDPSLDDSDGYAVLNSLPPDLYEYVRIPISPGLAILRPLQDDLGK